MWSRGRDADAFYVSQEDLEDWRRTNCTSCELKIDYCLLIIRFVQSAMMIDSPVQQRRIGGLQTRSYKLGFKSLAADR